MNHGLIVRIKYKDEEKFDWRLSLFKAMCIPRLEAQTDPNFDLVILCNPKHDERISGLSKKLNIKTIYHDVLISGDEGYKKLGRKLGESNSVLPFKMDLGYEITSRIDSDDMVSVDFIKTINDHFRGKDKISMMAFKEYRLNYWTLKLYKINPPDQAFSKSRFISVFDPTKKSFIYEWGHRLWSQRIKEKGGDIHVVDYGHAYVLYHFDNASTVMQPTDIPLEERKGKRPRNGGESKGVDKWHLTYTVDV